MNLERCIACDSATGKAGRGDGSLYYGDVGPLCEGCRDAMVEDVLDNHALSDHDALIEAAEDGKLIRDTSTSEKQEWWDSVREAASTAPKLKQPQSDAGEGEPTPDASGGEVEELVQQLFRAASVATYHNQAVRESVLLDFSTLATTLRNVQRERDMLSKALRPFSRIYITTRWPQTTSESEPIEFFGMEEKCKAAHAALDGGGGAVKIT